MHDLQSTAWAWERLRVGDEEVFQAAAIAGAELLAVQKSAGSTHRTSLRPRVGGSLQRLINRMNVADKGLQRSTQIAASSMVDTKRVRALGSVASPTSDYWPLRTSAQWRLNGDTEEETRCGAAPVAPAAAALGSLPAGAADALAEQRITLELLRASIEEAEDGGSGGGLAEKGSLEELRRQCSQLRADVEQGEAALVAAALAPSPPPWKPVVPAAAAGGLTAAKQEFGGAEMLRRLLRECHDGEEEEGRGAADFAAFPGSDAGGGSRVWSSGRIATLTSEQQRSLGSSSGNASAGTRGRVALARPRLPPPAAAEEASRGGR